MQVPRRLPRTIAGLLGPEAAELDSPREQCTEHQSTVCTAPWRPRPPRSRWPWRPPSPAARARRRRTASSRGWATPLSAAATACGVARVDDARNASRLAEEVGGPECHPRVRPKVERRADAALRARPVEHRQGVLLLELLEQLYGDRVARLVAATMRNGACGASCYGGSAGSTNRAYSLLARRAV